MGGGWVKAEGEPVEMRAVNSVSIGLQLCFFFFLNSIRQLPFSTSLCDCRTIVEKYVLFYIIKEIIQHGNIGTCHFFTSVLKKMYF